MAHLNGLLSIARLGARGHQRARHFIVFAALVGGLFPSAPLHAGPIIVSGAYSVFISGDDGVDTGISVSESGAFVGDFSYSLSESVSLSPPHTLEGSAAVTLTTSPNQIELVGSTSTSYPGSPDYPFAAVSSSVGVTIDIELTKAYVVSGGADFREAGCGAARGCSGISISGLPADVYYDSYGFGLGLFGVLPAGTYSVEAFADGFGIPGEGGGGEGFSLSLELTPVIPEPSAAIVFSIGIAIVVGARRWLS